MQRFDGRYGFFILPDLVTARKAQELACDILNHPDRIMTIPAIPLFFLPVVRLGENVVEYTIRRITCYVGHDFRLQNMTTHGLRAVFWNAVSDDNLRLMQTACMEALVRYHDKTWEPLSRKDSLELTNEERKNAATYGYPFVQSFFFPLAYRYAGFGLENRKAPHDATIRSVVFAEVGPHCTIGRPVEIR